MIKFERKPMLLQEVLANSWDLYKASFTTVWFWGFIISALYALPLLIGFLGVYEVDKITGHFRFSILGTLIFITFLIIATYLSILMLELMESILEGNKPTINFYLKDAMKKLFPVYLATLCYYLIILIGFMLFLFPGLFVWILFVMFLPLMIFDNLSPYDSFTTSMQMVWGNWWQTFFVMFIPSIIMYFIKNLFHYAHTYDFLTFLMELVVIGLMMPYFFAVLLVQYKNLKIKLSLPKPPGTEEPPRFQS